MKRRRVIKNQLPGVRQKGLGGRLHQRGEGCIYAGRYPLGGVHPWLKAQVWSETRASDEPREPPSRKQLQQRRGPWSGALQSLGPTKRGQRDSKTASAEGLKTVHGDRCLYQQGNAIMVDGQLSSLHSRREPKQGAALWARYYTLWDGLGSVARNHARATLQQTYGAEALPPRLQSVHPLVWTATQALRRRFPGGQPVVGQLLVGTQQPVRLATAIDIVWQDKAGSLWLIELKKQQQVPGRVRGPLAGVSRRPLRGAFATWGDTISGRFNAQAATAHALFDLNYLPVKPTFSLILCVGSYGAVSWSVPLAWITAAKTSLGVTKLAAVVNAAEPPAWATLATGEEGEEEAEDEEPELTAAHRGSSNPGLTSWPSASVVRRRSKLALGASPGLKAANPPTRRRRSAKRQRRRGSSTTTTTTSQPVKKKPRVTSKYFT